MQTQCVFENKLYNLNDTWPKSGDNCTTYKCEVLNNELSVSTQLFTCPDVSKCDPKYIIDDGCCKKCDLSTRDLGKCAPSSIAQNLTVGLVQFTINGHGTCKNLEGVKGLTQCTGSCDLRTVFKSGKAIIII